MMNVEAIQEATKGLEEVTTKISGICQIYIPDVLHVYVKFRYVSINCI